LFDQVYGKLATVTGAFRGDFRDLRGNDGLSQIQRRGRNGAVTGMRLCSGSQPLKVFTQVQTLSLTRNGHAADEPTADIGIKCCKPNPQQKGGLLGVNVIA
jgi:hypothetical protein